MSSTSQVKTIHARAHHGVMTEMESRYSSEDSRKPARLLACEFFDNSISALCRSLLATRRSRNEGLHAKQAIELHMFYGAPTEGHPQLEVRHASRHTAVAGCPSRD